MRPEILRAKFQVESKLYTGTRVTIRKSSAVLGEVKYKQKLLCAYAPTHSIRDPDILRTESDKLRLSCAKLKKV